VLWGSGTGLLLVFSGETLNIFLGRNLHVVVPGRVYRCSQRSSEDLEAIVRRHGIRTVVNLRGCCAPWPWYLEETRATHRLGVAQEDICFSAARLPSVHELRRLVEALDRTEYPILLHCRRGADRTGMASAIVLLLLTDVPLDAARRQLGLRYGHLALGRPAFLDRFLDLYAEWLRAQGETHCRTTFRRWAEHEYCPGQCRCRIEPLDVPASIPCGRPAALRVRVHNTSVKNWRLRAGTNAGFHAAFSLCDAQDRCVAMGRAGMFNAEVAPGQSIDLTLALPAVKAPGTYRLLVDMIDEQQCMFFQTGSELLEQEVIVSE
jgi:protein tyrosine phosphatase (PTP) superfamily phosphohydrolase (DUF442 family)